MTCMCRVAGLLLLALLVIRSAELCAGPPGQQDVTKPSGIRGPLVDVQLEASTITVAADDKTRRTFQVDKSTMIERNGQQIPLADLRANQMVMVVYITKEDNKHIAQSIMVETK